LTVKKSPDQLNTVPSKN